MLTMGQICCPLCQINSFEMSSMCFLHKIRILRRKFKFDYKRMEEIVQLYIEVNKKIKKLENELQNEYKNEKNQIKRDKL